ncbi:unnamed protein product [Amoebophrya sp. A120]|nr:unnamed protein product [Amoebophrya sp. A120]|eukprot:GSA120T00007059001.1
MRVRHLQSHLSDQHMIKQEQLGKLSGFRMGIDAVFWLRSIQALKDPFADAIGGVPPGIFGFVDKELQNFERKGIKPLFVFQGMTPPAQQQMYIHRLDSQMDRAWNCLAKGQRSEAQKCFAVSTSRINSDFVYFLYHHLKAKNYDCFQAPYFAGAQLAHFAEQGLINSVFGPPGLLLYGIEKCVIHIDFGKQTFDWLGLDVILNKWQITLPQFVDACMLAGTEYCLTYPFLNQDQYIQQQSNAMQNIGGNSRFNFEAAVVIIKHAPLVNWLETFPTEEMKNDHIEGYCTCKVLIKHGPVWNVQTNSVMALSQCVNKSTLRQAVNGNRNGDVSEKDDYESLELIKIPYDFSAVIGEMLPNSLYKLICEGIVSSKLPLALARGVWYDKSQPLLDIKEYRELLLDLKDYRQRALGLIARHLHPKFQSKRITMKAYWHLSAAKFQQQQILQLQQNSMLLTQAQSNPTLYNPAQIQALLQQQAVLQQQIQMSNEEQFLSPELREPMKWSFTKEEVKLEMMRQKTNAVDFVFCLKWHVHLQEEAGAANKQGKAASKQASTKNGQKDQREGLLMPRNSDYKLRLPAEADKNTLSAYCHFMVLENLDLLSPNGGMTVLGNVLQDIEQKEFIEPALIALELMKFGVMSGETWEPAVPEKPFPSQTEYPPKHPDYKSHILINRVISLVPMKLRNDMWNSDVNFDLAGFHTLIKILKRSLRQLSESCLASLLLPQLEFTNQLPKDFMCVTQDRKNHLQYPALLPAFPLPRACLGIICNFFLTYEGDVTEFRGKLEENFQCCVQPVQDLEKGMQFWFLLKRAVDVIAKSLPGAEDLAADMAEATRVLRKQASRLHVRCQTDEEERRAKQGGLRSSSASSSEGALYERRAESK